MRIKGHFSHNPVYREDQVRRNIPSNVRTRERQEFEALPGLRVFQNEIEFHGFSVEETAKNSG